MPGLLRFLDEMAQSKNTELKILSKQIQQMYDCYKKRWTKRGMYGFFKKFN